jgi:hypothetical protein
LFCKCGFNLRDTHNVGQPLERGRVLKINGKALHRSLPIEIVALLLINVPSSDRLSAHPCVPSAASAVCFLRHAFRKYPAEHSRSTGRGPRRAPQIDCLLNHLIPGFDKLAPSESQGQS